ncbi:MAG TPA: class I SAM-dependent methyltransferase [Thermoanaerobaculia bacterium]|nr:class I SAM-dependent methyltransferase [Thermoanaerobaculia bacterium]
MSEPLAPGLDPGAAQPAIAGPAAAASPAATRAPIDLETYYTEAGMDYRAWSRGFNMHFGFWRAWMNPFALERMLERMSREVFARLALADGDRVLDLGCGVGAPARTLVAERRVTVTAVTKVEWQIAMARRLADGTHPLGSVEWLLGDYTALELPPASFQGAFSIEASCHAAGAAKEPFVREAARLLAPGARLVVADGFMKKARIPRWYSSMLGYMTRSWAVERFADLDAFTACLERHGLAVEAVEDVSYRIAPSVLHVPRVTLEFLLRELMLRRRWLNRARWGHVIACLIAPFVGLGRAWFGYYLVTARKRL